MLRATPRPTILARLSRPIAVPVAAAFAALALAACGQAETQPDWAAAGPDNGRDEGPFTIELAASDAQAVHYIHGGRYGRAAALVTYEGDPDAARLIRGSEAEPAWREAAGALDLPAPDPDDLVIKIFGFELYADEGEGDGGEVRFDARIPGDRQFSLNAAGEGEDGAARMTFSGWGRRDTANYIDDIDDAPRDLREKMKDQLGL